MGKLITAARFVSLLPRIVMTLHNWIDFTGTYLGFRHECRSIRTRDGYRISLSPKDSRQEVMVFWGIFIAREYGNVKESSVVIDIGAHIGVFAIWAARKSGTRVFAYEPLPTNFERLRENIHANGLEHRIRPICQAVAAEEGIQDLRVSVLSDSSTLCVHGSDEQRIPVVCTTLERIMDDNKIDCCEMLKLDCEGSEFDILETAPVDVLYRINRIRLEYHQYSGETRLGKLTDRLGSAGFALTRHVEYVANKQGILWFSRLVEKGDGRTRDNGKQG